MDASAMDEIKPDKDHVANHSKPDSAKVPTSKNQGPAMVEVESVFLNEKALALSLQKHERAGSMSSDDKIIATAKAFKGFLTNG